MPFVPIVFLAAVVGYIYFSSRKRHEEGPPSGPGPAYGPVPMPGLPPHHHHRHEGLPQVAPPAVPAWLEPGMPPEYAQAVWRAYYFERDPRNLHAFGERLHEMQMHRAAEALHRRGEAMEYHHAQGGAPHMGHGVGQWSTPTADCQDAKPNMTVCASVAAALATESDTLKLKGLADQVRAMGFPKAAQALLIKASMLGA